MANNPSEAKLVEDINGDLSPTYFNPSTGKYEYLHGADGLQFTGNHVMTESGIWIPQRGSEDGVAHMQVTGSNVELEVNAKLDRIDELITNQREIINVMNSDKLIFGAYWDKSSNPSLTRTDAAVGMEADVGIDGQLVQNDFDKAPIWGEIEEVQDSYGNYFMRIPKFYIRKIS